LKQQHKTIDDGTFVFELNK